jgi:subfamily B ATP-binding cassette protein MsbA
VVIALDRVYEFLDRVPEIHDADDAVDCPEAPESILFDNITFGYRSDLPVLKEINFEAVSGTITAVVGPTGAGKTTLINMIPRFIDPQSGEVKLNGRGIKGYKVRSLRDKTGIAMQETIIFNGSFLDNIRYGDPEAGMEQVEKAARTACLHEYIMSQPDGYNTQVGEKGGRLSVGQRQLLGIARAVLRDAPILILDEPTSALDVDTEHLLACSLERIREDKIIFVVAHRLSTIRQADCILFMEDGRIVERGKHDELMNIANGRYREHVTAHTGALEP